MCEVTVACFVDFDHDCDTFVCTSTLIRGRYRPRGRAVVFATLGHVRSLKLRAYDSLGFVLIVRTLFLCVLVDRRLCDCISADISCGIQHTTGCIHV